MNDLVAVYRDMRKGKLLEGKLDPDLVGFIRNLNARIIDSENNKTAVVTFNGHDFKIEMMK